MPHEDTFYPDPDDSFASLPATAEPEHVAEPAPAAIWAPQPAAAWDEQPAYEPYEPPVRKESAQDQVRGRGISMEHNYYGHISVGVGGAALLATVIMFFAGGVLWVYVGAGLASVYYGVRGWNAAARRFATNGRTAAVGIALGCLTLLGAVAYVVFFVLQAAAIVGEATGA
ncbi:hypothetical protein [Demequina gelatinilytica]|uniref:hypothetical protein n=1 Tax=Demequina gelatinilytica TaxID=1638980 RepID=UPI0007843D38|nr:hypothetical protein [Demequina gelatinilytica]